MSDNSDSDDPMKFEIFNSISSEILYSPVLQELLKTEKQKNATGRI